MSSEESHTTAPAPIQPASGAPLPGSGLSIAGFSIGLASLLLNFFTLGITAIVGLVLSIVGYNKTKRAGKASGFAIWGIVASSVAIIATIAFFGYLLYVGFQVIAECQEIQNGAIKIGTESIICKDGVPVTK